MKEWVGIIAVLLVGWLAGWLGCFDVDGGSRASIGQVLCRDWWDRNCTGETGCMMMILSAVLWFMCLDMAMQGGGH